MNMFNKWTVMKSVNLPLEDKQESGKTKVAMLNDYLKRRTYQV